MPSPSTPIFNHPSASSSTLVQASVLSSPVIQNSSLLPALEPASGPDRSKKGRHRKAKAGTKQGASSVKPGSSFASVQPSTSVRQTSDIPTVAERQNLCKVGNGIIVTVAAVAQETLSMAGGYGNSSGNFTSVEGLLHRITMERVMPLSSK